MSIFDFFRRNKKQDETERLEEEVKKRLLDSNTSLKDMYGDGTNSDVLPGSTGEFGWEITNPIPLQSIPASYVYLENLRFTDGMKVIYNRKGSVESDISTHPMDVYQITHPDGTVVGDLYISPYHKRNSNLKPKGLK